MLHLATWDGGFSVYLVTCLISVATGLGLLRVLRFETSDCRRLIVAPVLAMALWIVLLGAGVTLCFPLRDLSIAGAASASEPAGKCLLLLVACVLIPIIPMFLYFRNGLADHPGSSVGRPEP